MKLESWTAIECAGFLAGRIHGILWIFSTNLVQIFT